MNHEFYEVENALNRLESLQDEHIESFQTQLLPDLEGQTAKRKEAFNHLTCCLEKFFTQASKGDEKTVSMIQIFSKQIERLQHQNLVLKEKVETHREDLKARMKKITKGRKAIRSYRPPSSFLNRPRAISVTN